MTILIARLIRTILIILLIISMLISQYFENIYSETSNGIMAVFLLIIEFEAQRREK